jgi:hypothetical protein
MRDFSHRTQMENGTSNPFIDDVFVDQPGNLPGAAQIHQRAFNRIVDAVELLAGHSEQRSPADFLGRIVLVTAPRAGFGKSHLSARLRHHLQSVCTSLTVDLDSSRPVSWPVVLHSILRQFINASHASEGPAENFERTGRYLLSQLTLSHLVSGTFEQQACPESVERLRTEFFDLYSPDSPKGMLNWIDKRSRELSRDADGGFLRALGLTSNELGFWTRLVIDFHLRGDSALEPLRGLSNGEARERLLQWLRIAAFHRPILLLADGLDGFFRSETAGMEIAGLLTSIRESVPRSITLVSVNEDLWNSVFEDKLPSAWLDRITGDTESLGSISLEAACELVRFRLRRTEISEPGADQFVKRLRDDRGWLEEDARLSPRVVLREASDLWNREARSFLRVEVPSPDSDTTLEEEISEKPLSALTDKVEFFESLQQDRSSPSSSPPPLPESVPPREADPTADRPSEPAPSFPDPTRSEIPREEPEKPTFPDNPFYAEEENRAEEHLAGIDSIIADIRGSGSTVVSETPSQNHPTSEPADPGIFSASEEPEIFSAGSLNVKPVRNGNAPRDTSSPPESAPSGAAPAVNVEVLLRQREEEMLRGGALRLDLARIEHFIRMVGGQHSGLSQTEERFPGSQSVCLRWMVHGQSVLVGFESPANVYFWNNLLQQSLASTQLEKIAAFSHTSEPFDPGLFSSFGFSPAVAVGHIDIIELTDRELAMLYAADQVVSETAGTESADRAVQMITRQLDPLWRRISQPL